jgi:hypothetical protein
MAAEDDQAKKSVGRPMAEERGDKPQHHPKDTFDILLTKYKEGRAGVRGCEN